MIKTLPTNPPPSADRRASVWQVTLLVAGLLLLTYWLRIVLLPFAIAGALAFVIAPVVRWGEQRLHIPRALAAVAVFVVFLGLLAGVGLWIEHICLPQFLDFGRQAPERLRQLFRHVAGSDQIHIFGGDLTADQLIQSGIADFQQWIGGPFAAIAGAMLFLVMGFLTLVLLFFFLLHGPKLLAGMRWLVPPRMRPAASRVGRQIGPIFRRYFLGVIIIVIITSVLSWIGIGLLLHLPQAVVLSIAVGFLEAVPVVGPIISAALLALAAVSNGSTGIVIGVTLFALSLRLFIDQIVGPLILGKTVELHPVVVILAFLVGGTLFGLLGIFLAVPAARTIVVVLQDVYGNRAVEKQVRNNAD